MNYEYSKNTVEPYYFLQLFSTIDNTWLNAWIPNAHYNESLDRVIDYIRQKKISDIHIHRIVKSDNFHIHSYWLNGRKVKPLIPPLPLIVGVVGGVTYVEDNS